MSDNHLSFEVTEIEVHDREGQTFLGKFVATTETDWEFRPRNDCTFSSSDLFAIASELKKLEQNAQTETAKRG